MTVMDCVSQDENIADVAFGVTAKIAAGGSFEQQLFSGLFYLEQTFRSMGCEDAITSAHNMKKFMEIGKSELLRGISEARAYFVSGGPKVYAQGIVNRLNYKRNSRRIENIFTPT